MANDRIGCSNNRLTVVDPNLAEGFSSSNNISVPLEDLNISVQLKTWKKGRTVLSANNGVGTSESSKTVKVSFIEGSEINGKKVLTTKYTDLTTNFESGNNDETLGITNIDIDFNPSMAPMVNITFIDVRGSAIFQNESNLIDGTNKYSTFFQLPYPLYELTVKGYYGRAVKYCLHMTKFNSKFNSQTGNFEITANFIGYTYAMLSDMLIGILKAIPYTKIGGEIYKEINEQRIASGAKEILDLNQLMIKISTINEALEKISATERDAAVVGSDDEKKELIASLINEIVRLGTNIEDKDKTTTTANGEYKYILAIKNPSEYSALITEYNQNIASIIKKLNDLQGNISFDVNKFKPILYPKFLGSDFLPSLKLDILETKLGDDFERKATAIFSIIRDTITSQNAEFYIYDTYEIYNQIYSFESSVDKTTKDAQKSLAETLKTTIGETIGFQPTVRAIVEVFTTAIEVFLTTIYRVSMSAEDNNKILRDAQLAPKFKETPKSNDFNGTDTTFFPWPDYREKDNTGKNLGFVEKYLGDVGVLQNWRDVDELVFIDDLVKAFLTAQKEADLASLVLEQTETNWIPINPIDTRISANGLNLTTPYTRKNGLFKEDIIRMMLIRGMTFLGYTNSEGSLTNEEITTMANAEAESVFIDIPDQSVLDTLTKTKFDDFKLSSGIINNEKNFVVKNYKDYETGSQRYFYKYMVNTDYSDSVCVKIIPISGIFTGDITPDSNKDNLCYSTYVNLSDTETFLTNYNSSVSSKYIKDGDTSDNNDFIKPEDGGVYIDIIQKNEYEASSTNKLRAEVPSEIVPLVLSNLKSLKFATQKNDKVNTLEEITKAGFLAFAGPYGIQEFSKMNYDSNNLGVFNLKYVFYEDNAFQGLGRNRKALITKKNTVKYDLIDDNTNKIKKDLTPIYGYNTSILINGRDKDYKDVTNDPINFLLHAGFGLNRKLFKELEDNNNGLSYPYVNQLAIYDDKSNSFSLFGSKWYYLQDHSKYPKYSKALLFLNTFPWNRNNKIFGGSFEAPEILHLFDIKGGFIQAPKLWCAFIGGLLWRADSSNPIKNGNRIIGGGSGNVDPIYWEDNKGNLLYTSISAAKKPNRTQYFTSLYMTDDIKYNNYHKLLIGLPEQVKNKFKSEFFKFVNNDFDTLKNGLEIWPDTKTGVQYNIELIKIFNGIVDSKSFSSSLLNNLINLDRYNIVTPRMMGFGSNIDDTMFLELKGDETSNQSISNIIKAMTEEVIIVNNGYNIWGNTKLGERVFINNKWQQVTGNRDMVSVSEKDFKLYFSAITSNFNTKVPTATSSKKQDEERAFGTSNMESVKLQLYRTCKNIYDKWVGGASSPDRIIFQCGGDDNNTILRNSQDIKIANNYNSTTPKLIDSFRFVTRSFADISNDLFINPTPVGEYLRNNPNSNSYDAITSLLTSNNFTVTPLPTFINYHDPAILSSMFDTVVDSNIIENGACGPAFVCVYIGQTSKHLDVNESQYSNDGFDIRCKDGEVVVSPEDFTTTPKEYEDKVAVFKVGFGQQNQNIFKDITLDQSEFGETAESLLIVDDITKNGGENNRSFAGQNIYNVYAVRSYKAEVEMLGNAMIQPMMYFQLDNIPMYHGAYLITQVKHNIKPNYMSTRFSGVRIREPQTKIFDAADLYMELIDSLDLSTASGTDNPNNNFIDSYYIDLQANIPQNKTIIGSTIPNKVALTNTAEQEIKNWKNGSLLEKNGTQFLDKYVEVTPGISSLEYSTNAQPWSAIFTSYIMKSGDNKFPNSPKHYDYITNAMNSNYGYEVFPLKSGLTIKAEVGDLMCHKRSGGYTNSHCNVIYKTTENKASLVGGNLSDSVRTSEIILVNGNITDTTNIGDYKILIKKTNYAYYNNKKILGTGNHIIPAVPTGGKNKLPAPNPNIKIIPQLSNSDRDFYTKVLNKINAPVSEENIKFFIAWHNAESGASGNAAWNPFNTTQKAQGTTNFNNNNGNPVKNYPTKEVGIDATVKTLLNSRYPKLLAGLRGDIGAGKLSQILDELTIWGTGSLIAEVLSKGKITTRPIATKTTKIA